MSQCPVCQAPVTADFGLTECDKCGAQLIVHIDGTVEDSSGQAADAAAANAESDRDIAEATDHEIELAGVPDRSTAFGSETEAFVADFNNSESAPADPAGTGEPPEESPEYDFMNEDAEAEEALVAPTEGAGPASADAEFNDIFAEPAPAEEGAADATIVYKPPGPVSDSADLSDIAKFGNSEAAGSKDGNLRYDVLITGVDTSDVRLALREALTDRKFLWDVDQILRSLRNGSVRIQNISPAKAHILISRLRGMPVKVRWEQYGIQQA